VRRSESRSRPCRNPWLRVEIETQQRQLFELPGQQAVVPDRDFGQAIVRDPKGTDLRRGEVIEAKRGSSRAHRRPKAVRDPRPPRFPIFSHLARIWLRRRVRPGLPPPPIAFEKPALEIVRLTKSLAIMRIYPDYGRAIDDRQQPSIDRRRDWHPLRTVGRLALLRLEEEARWMRTPLVPPLS
jgi:hypothetical protein